MTEPKIFTMTLSINLGYDVNLLNIAKYLPINDTILGIKYKFGEINFIKGLYLTKSKQSFYNQASLIVKLNDKNINVKVFPNGKLQLTGCKRKSDGYELKNILLTYFKSINGIDKINKKESESEHVVFIDNSDFVYSLEKESNCIGYYLKNSDDYIIENKLCKYIKSLNVFISKKTSGSHTYPIYNINGKCIGKKIIKLLKNCKKIYNNQYLEEVINPDDIKTNLLMSGETVIGKICYEIDESNCSGGGCSNCSVNYNKSILKDKNKEFNNDKVEIYSAMFSFNLNFKINRQKLYSLLLSNSFITKFEPERYSGVYWMLKLDTNKNINKCITSNCYDISSMFFQSGNVVCSGIKNEEDILLVYNYLLLFLNKNKELIQVNQF